MADRLSVWMDRCKRDRCWVNINIFIVYTKIKININHSAIDSGASQEEFHGCCMWREGLIHHYLHIYVLLTFYHASLLLCNIMVKNSWEIIKNIFNDIPSLWGLAISQWSGMFHNLNTIVSDYLGRLFFLLSLLIPAIVDSHIGESSLPTCYFPKQREGTTRPSSRQAHVTCDLLFWKIPQLSAKPQQKKKNDIRESKSPGTKTPLPVHLGTSGPGQSILGTEIKALVTVWPLVHLLSERPKLHVAFAEESGQSLDFKSMGHETC